MTDDRKRKLAELDAMETEQKVRAEAHARELQAELQDRRVQRGIEALIRAEVEDTSAEISGKVAEINTAQVRRLALRLAELELIDLADDPDEEIGAMTINDLWTGEIVVAIDDGESMFWEHGRDVIEQRPARGGIEFRRIGPDGNPGEWQLTPPPPSRAACN